MQWKTMVESIQKTEENRDLSQTETSKSEEDLVQGLVDKQDWAFRELVERWSDKLYQVAYRLLRNEEQAQEVLQEVFKKVIEKIHTFKGGSKLYTWLYRVTVNEGLMRIRSRKKRFQISWEDVLPRFEDEMLASRDQFSDWSKLPDEKLMEAEARDFIQQCIEDLPEDYRLPYILKDVQQLSENEVCEALEITKSVMKIRVHRARLYIRKRLEQRYVDHE